MTNRQEGCQFFCTKSVSGEGRRGVACVSTCLASKLPTIWTSAAVTQEKRLDTFLMSFVLSYPDD